METGAGDLMVIHGKGLNAVKDGFYRIAAATPPVAVANVEENQAQILEKIQQAASQGCGAVCFQSCPSPPTPAGFV